MEETITEEMIYSCIMGEEIPESDAIKTYCGDWITEEYADNNDYVLLGGTNNGEYCHIDDCVFSNKIEEWLIISDDDLVYAQDIEDYIYESDAWEVYETGEYVAEYSEDYVLIDLGRADGYALHYDWAIFCYDIDKYVHEYDATYCDYDGNYYWDEDEMPGRCDSEHICDYHNSPHVKDLSNGSLFKIGFEIEKTDFFGNDDVGDFIGEHRLFKGYETDSSCGVEAITHILPLGLQGSDYEKDVFVMIDEASEVINSNLSLSCGGHINISCSKMGTLDILPKVRGYVGLLYAMYRYRLKNTYLDNNKKLAVENNQKYSPVNIKSSCLEFRLFSGVKNTETLKLRYQLMAIFMHYSVKPYGTFDGLIRSCKPIINKMYNGNKNKIDKVIKLAYLFRNYILIDSVHPDIEEFVKR